MALTKITSAIIESGAIDATALANNSITIDHLDCSDGTSGQFLKTDGSGNLSFGSVPAGYTDSDVESYLSGGTGVTFSSGVISIGQDVGTSSTPTFGNTITGTLQATSFSDGTISGITFIDEDSFATNSSTRVPTQQSIKAYVDAEVAGVVDSAPAALDTLNELAAALGDDANFSTTTSTALGNRLRVDTASQGLTGTQQANAITNLGITATKAELNYVDGVTSNIQTQLNGKQATGSYLTGNQTITLSGDASGSGTTSIAVTVADDSHNHIISNVDGLQAALDAKLASSSYTASDVLTKIKTVDGSGSGLDADTVDGLQGTDIVETSNGTSSDLDTNLSAQMFGFATSTSNRPQNYGQGLTIVSSGKTHNNSNNWATQLAFGTDENSMYFRGKTNAGSWNSWRNVWHTGNDGSGSGLDADTVDGLQASQFLRSDADDTSSGNITSNNLYVADDIGHAGDSDTYMSFENDYLGFYTGGANTLVLSSGQVGINRAPTISNSKLEVGGADNVPLINVEASGATGGMGIGSTGLQLFHGSTQRMRIASNGETTITGTKMNVVSSAEAVMGAQATGYSYWRVVADNSPNTYFQAGTGQSSSQVKMYFTGMFGSNNTMTVDTPNSRVGIGTTSPGKKLDVRGTVRSLGGSSYNDISLSDELPGYGSQSYGNIKASANNVYFSIGSSYVSYIAPNGSYNVSDLRLKENITDLSGSLDKILQLRGVNYTWKDTENRGAETHIGFIAQEVEEVLPELVGDGGLPIDEDGNEAYKNVNYANLVPVLVEAIKELKAENDALKTRLDAGGL